MTDDDRTFYELSDGRWRARMIADSMPPHGVRLTTMELRFPRFVLAEFNTHRMFSRNSASSRAIPVEKLINAVDDDPFIPKRFPKNQPGMQAAGFFEGFEHEACVEHWLWSKNNAIKSAKALNILGVHKQIVNRVLEPFMWHTALVSATDWGNFFGLRNHPDAQPEIQVIARLAQELYEVRAGNILGPNAAHLPLVFNEDREQFELYDLQRLSVARCARVSYLTHDGVRDPQKDFVLHDRLLESRHLSPFEHVATVDPDPYKYIGNFRGWKQIRKGIPFEADASAYREWTTGDEEAD